ncbi:hypothetical protein [Coraliomargarita parva]|uniref:hypothetical protein n=1 Tax=Coraliomargarita parva TaxID=3014050 RepID=UPI0022B34144|nr:hypothetical protein [Coraliomargarita parva]
MKRLYRLSLTLFTLALLSPLQAGNSADEDSARYYKSNPGKFDGQKVDVDCIFVKRPLAANKIEGVTFFVAQTKDKDNHSFGGTIVVAVLSDEAESFLRKYGDAPDINRGAAEKVDSKRLRGIFHLLESGHVYIDESDDGKAHDRILANLEAAQKAINSADGGPRDRKKPVKKRQL